MANTTQHMASQLEQLASQVNGAGNTLIVCPVTNAWYPALAQLKTVDSVLGSSQIYGNIASAVAACVSGRGDTIIVTPGTYTLPAEVVVSKNNVTIVGAGAIPEATRIVGTATDTKCAFAVTANNVTFKNLHIEGGNSNGSAIASTGAYTTVLDCRFGNDTAPSTQKAGVLVDASAATATLAPKIRRCRFFGSVIAIAFNSGAGATNVVTGANIEDCVFGNNGSGDIVSLGTVASTGVLISRCTFLGGSNNKMLKYTSPALNGLVSGCYFNVATNSQAAITDGQALGATQGYVGNYTLAGLSTAKPA